MNRTDKEKLKKVQPQTLDDFVKLCRNAGLRITPQKMAVYKELLESKNHPSAENIHKKLLHTMPGISLDTVNRNLLTITDLGAAFIVEGSGDARRFDANIKKHQHFKCIKCKRIIDFHNPRFDNISLPRNLEEKFHVLRCTVYFEGLCENCRRRKSKNKA